MLNLVVVVMAVYALEGVMSLRAFVFCSLGFVAINRILSIIETAIDLSKGSRERVKIEDKVYVEERKLTRRQEFLILLYKMLFR